MSHLGSKSSIPIISSWVDQQPDWEPVPGEIHAMHDGRLHFFPISGVRVENSVFLFLCNPRGNKSGGHGREDLFF